MLKEKSYDENWKMSAFVVVNLNLEQIRAGKTLLVGESYKGEFCPKKEIS